MHAELHCVVPENIHTPPTEGIGISRGVGGSKAQENPEGGGCCINLYYFSRPVPLFLYVTFSVCILLTDPRTQTLILLTAQN